MAPLAVKNYGLGALGVPYRYIAAASLLFGPLYGFQARSAAVGTWLGCELTCIISSRCELVLSELMTCVTWHGRADIRRTHWHLMDRLLLNFELRCDRASLTTTARQNIYLGSKLQSLSAASLAAARAGDAAAAAAAPWCPLGAGIGALCLPAATVRLLRITSYRP
jgi:hypothetical protein